MSKRQILPSGEADFERIGRYYRIRAELDDWCRQIAAEAHRDDRPMTGLGEIPIERVFANLELDAAMPGSRWAHQLERFRAENWDDAVELKRRLSWRRPPWHLRLNSRIFAGLEGAVPVDVRAVYDVDPGTGTATFIWFEAYTPGPSGAEASDQPRSW